MYSDLFLKKEEDKTIPFYLYVPALLLIGGILIFSGIKNTTQSVSASPVKLAEHTTYTVGSTQVGVFFRLEKKLPAYIVYGTSRDTLDKSAYDIRDIAGSPSPRSQVYIELSQLTPLTQYYYRIIADDKVIALGEDQGDTGTFSTSSSQPSAASRPIYGKYASADGKGIEDALVIVSANPFTPEKVKVVTTKTGGEWLANIWWYTADDAPLMISLLSDSTATSKVKAVANRAAPLPQTIIAGTDYSFIAEGKNVLPASTTRSDAKDYVISLAYPEPNAVITVNKPLIKGKGIPGSSVTVIIASNPPLKLETTVSKTGTWLAESAKAFAPGRYTLQVLIQDNTGAQRTLERSFTIAKAGEQVLGETTQTSTPSATLIPSKVPTGGPTSIPTVKPSVIPTLASSITPIISIVPVSPGPSPAIYCSDTITVNCIPPGGMHEAIVYIGAFLALLGVFFLRTSRLLS